MSPARAFLSLTRAFSIRSARSSFFGITLSAAADGVAALRSATKSAIVKSTSCPTALTIGTLLAALAGSGVSTAHIIPNAMIPDAIEWEELQRGQRREGMFYSMITLMNKVASSVAVPWAALTLALAGFDEALGMRQPPPALMAIRLLVGLAPAVLMSGGIALAALYPLNRERHAEIRRLLAQR